MGSKLIICGFFFALLASFPANAALLDVKARKNQLQTPEYATIRELCLAGEEIIKQPAEEIPKPVNGLKGTEGYGSDKSLSDLGWFLMIHGGRALAGEKTSAGLVRDTLLQWADAQALAQTEEVHDAYYALKRGLSPIIVSYMIVRDDLSSKERKQIETWIDPLVRRVDKKFGGDVDYNNHRYLADSVLTLWGDVTGDKKLYAKGKERFEIALDQMRPDGSLPLETRRGARALWYMRQSLANLTLIAEIYKNNGEDLYRFSKDGKSLPLMMDYFISAVRNPLLVLEDSSENYIPGPSNNFLEQDFGTLERRGGKRHYMAFAHIYIAHYGVDEISAAGLEKLMKETGYQELPLIDDYIGGNATCFWGRP